MPCRTLSSRIFENKGRRAGGKVIVIFTVLVEVPRFGAQILLAGTYLFKVLDPSPDRNIIHISIRTGLRCSAHRWESRTPV